MDTLSQYDKCREKARNLFVMKTKDYGTSWRILRPSSLTDQLFIKANRIRTIEVTGQNKVEESIDDEFVALYNYSVMAIIQCRNNAPYSEWTPQEATLHYDGVSNEIKELMIRKNHDYGEAWRSMRVSSLTDLILTKILRIKQIEDNSGTTLASEGVEANYMDIANYSIFALILLEWVKK